MIVLSMSCSNSASIIQEDLELIGQFALSIPEPSGLSFSASGSSLYTVSDETNKIYNISKTGSILNIIDFTGNDIEGISLDRDNGQIWVVEERDRKVIKLTADGTPTSECQLQIEQNDANSGLEGIAINQIDKSLYVLNEKNPGLLLELDSNGKILKETNLRFASDYSGIFHDELNDQLWILSDQSRTINRSRTDGVLIESFNINVTQAEGIAVNSTEQLIYVVSDATENLYVFKY